jgi:hypothetical protein
MIDPGVERSNAEAAAEYERNRAAAFKFWQRRHEVAHAPPIEFPVAERNRLAAEERERQAKERQANTTERRKLANNAGRARIEALTVWKQALIDTIRAADPALRQAVQDCDTEAALDALRIRRDLPALLNQINIALDKCHGNGPGAGLFYDNYGRLVPAERI